jgi:DNA-binding CsgD family transcriptional regulator
MARRLGDTRLEAAALRTLGNLLVRGADLAGGIARLEHALTLASAADEPAEAAECCAGLLIACAWAARFRRAQEVGLLQLDFARRCHDRYQMRHVFGWLAYGRAYQGRWEEAGELLAQARAVVDQLDSPEPRAFLDYVGGWLAYLRGDDASAIELLTRSAAAFRAIGPGALVWYLGPLGVAQAGLGLREEAGATLAELEGLLSARAPDGIAAPEALTCLSALAVALGDRGRMTPCYARLEPFRGLYANFLVDRIRGVLATALGDWPAARACLDAAEVTARREGIGPELAHVLADRAAFERARGGRGSGERARRLVDQACALFEALGMAGEVRRLRDRCGTVPGHRDAPAARAHPAGMSTREVEVLRLVAAGKSNRQIAAELRISEKTVINHLTSIFNKTTTGNRAAATAFAIRHGLA